MKKKLIQHKKGLKWLIALIIAIFVFGVLPKQCTSTPPPTTHLTNARDSLPSLKGKGITTFISDSGYMKYRIIAQEWSIYDKTTPPRQEFDEGICIERFNKNDTLDLYFIADTAYCYDELLWHFKGDVVIVNLEKKVSFNSDELYWDRKKKIFYSNKYVRLKKPEEMLEGDRFKANEQFTIYSIYKSNGYIPRESVQTQTTTDSIYTDTVKQEGIKSDI